MPAEVFLYAPQNFNNLCALSRTLDVLGVARCHVFDPNRLVRPRYGKSNTRRIRSVSTGAFYHIDWVRHDDPELFIREQRSRTVATVPGGASVSLDCFEFADDDVLVFGAESSGLPAELLALCDVAVCIPQSGRTQSLNLSVAAGILLAERARQLRMRSSAAGIVAVT